MRKGGSASMPPSRAASTMSSEQANLRTDLSASLPADSLRDPRMRSSSRDAQAGDRGFAHSGGDYSSPAGIGDDGGAVFEVPFEAFFGAQGEASPNARSEPSSKAASGSRSRRAPMDEPDEATTPQADTYERSSTTRAARAGARDKSPAEKQRPERSLKGRALGYLSRREYSRAELSRKLMPYTDDADALEALLDSLEREGWLSDARFAESVVHRRAARVGAGRIVSELKRHAVGDALIEEVSTQLRETELVRARAVWQKKYGQLPETPAERARQARFLAARGFSMSIIGKILKGLEEDCSGN